MFSITLRRFRLRPKMAIVTRTGRARSFPGESPMKIEIGQLPTTRDGQSSHLTSPSNLHHPTTIATAMMRHCEVVFFGNDQRATTSQRR
ncbi:hypothetical protein TIFTF001_023046 [Ficus carica]|uniref:Uncharacterized protein n=1 Tax=Ficus carica TaxID=3494 RepID=A0AA88DFZ8_FICCA|nr:hypothetical protein TIFTF001_023046 [Ficus carica]